MGCCAKGAPRLQAQGFQRSGPGTGFPERWSSIRPLVLQEVARGCFFAPGRRLQHANTPSLFHVQYCTVQYIQYSSSCFVVLEGFDSGLARPSYHVIYCSTVCDWNESLLRSVAGSTQSMNEEFATGGRTSEARCDADANGAGQSAVQRGSVLSRTAVSF